MVVNKVVPTISFVSTHLCPPGNKGPGVTVHSRVEEVTSCEATFIVIINGHRPLLHLSVLDQLECIGQNNLLTDALIH